MIKSAAIALTLLSLSTWPVYAYTDHTAGYSINDRQPEAIIKSNNLYAFADKNENSIAVHTFTADEVEQLTGIKFSTAVFQEEYGKLALLQRSQLSLKTLPIPLLDLSKYQQAEDKIFLGANNTEKEPEIRIDKFNKQPAITLCYTDIKDEPTTYVSFLSANDKLYIMSFTANEIQPPIDDSKEPASDQALWQQYLRSAKTFKTFKPAAGCNSLSYYDGITKKMTNLPADWVYLQANFKDQYNQGCLTASVPLTTMRSLVKIIQQDLKLNTVGEIKKSTETILPSADMAELTSEKILRQREEASREIASVLDEALITTSLKVKDENWQELFMQPDAAQLEVTMMMEYALQRLKNFNNEYFAINKYTYGANFNKDSASMQINSDISLYQKYNFDTAAKIYCTPKNQVSLLLYLKKQASQATLNMAELQKNWQF